MLQLSKRPSIDTTGVPVLRTRTIQLVQSDIYTSNNQHYERHKPSTGSFHKLRCIIHCTCRCYVKQLLAITISSATAQIAATSNEISVKNSLLCENLQSSGPNRCSMPSKTAWSKISTPPGAGLKPHHPLQLLHSTWAETGSWRLPLFKTSRSRSPWWTVLSIQHDLSFLNHFHHGQ